MLIELLSTISIPSWVLNTLMGSWKASSDMEYLPIRGPMEGNVRVARSAIAHQPRALYRIELRRFSLSENEAQP
jgi:hypothetical protein